MTIEKSVMCLLEAMDCLWFHQTILSSEPSPKTTPTTSESPDCLSKDSSLMAIIPEQEISPLASMISCPHEDETTSSEKSDQDKETTDSDRPTRLNLSSTKTRFSSSSPTSANKKSRKLKYSYSSQRLKKSTSCKSLADLELEEVKGFMDLGFDFKKENMSKRMMSLIPGLQRLDGCKNGENTSGDNCEFTKSFDESDFEDEYEEDKKKMKGIMRPYLSEAWLVKRNDSPLLKLRIQSVSTSADMKKHLKYWARSVASTIHQESS